MKHEFTDEQIYTAKHLAASRMNRDWISRFNVKDIRAFLDALPEPESDEWQECRFEDVQKGDRVKVVDTHEAGDKTAYEGDVLQVSKDLVMTAHHPLHSVYNSKWYRIPAPVQHPDPAEHPAIVVIEADCFKGQDPQVLVWTGGKYENDSWMFDEDDITDWLPIDPAKVVEGDR
jgi:hypothetical protein